MRINQFIAHAGVCARRAAESLILQGKITINEKIVTDLAYRVKPDDLVKYKNNILQIKKKYYILLYKPRKYVTTVHDPEQRATVLDLVKLPYPTRIYPVGRLDYLTTGLLILTNDGALTEYLSHPSHGILKTYEVRLNKPILPKDLIQIKEGVLLEDGPVPIHALSQQEKNKVTLTIHIGRNRIIRRLFQHLGYHVTQLTRTKYAHLTLKGLTQGQWRYLTAQELKKLKNISQKLLHKTEQK